MVPESFLIMVAVASPDAACHHLDPMAAQNEALMIDQ
jgi:hypothetical protein